ncbi:MAG TPA: hypothetical protein VFH08_14965 [Chitinophagaceae bacterium]|nr:hypothetical protein [Chitinophagaceae bacterium]
MLRLINSLIKRFRQMRARHQLKCQQLLIRKGVGMKTEVLEVKEEGHPLKDYVQLCIFTRLRINGKIVYRKVRTLINDGSSLHSGDKVRIRYNPYHLNIVLLSGLTKN